MLLKFLFLLGILGIQTQCHTGSYSVSSIKIISDTLTPYYGPSSQKHFSIPTKEVL